MPEYYAIERSQAYLKHYGIKGMKWGVRKAVEKGNYKRLMKHYRKAQNKLEKLNQIADKETQQANADSARYAPAVYSTIGGLYGAMSGGLSAAIRSRGKSLQEGNKAVGIGAGIGAGVGAGVGALNGLKDLYISKRRLKDDVLKKNIEKRNKFRDAFVETFSDKNAEKLFDKNATYDSINDAIDEANTRSLINAKYIVRTALSQDPKKPGKYELINRKFLVDKVKDEEDSIKRSYKFKKSDYDKHPGLKNAIRETAIDRVAADHSRFKQILNTQGSKYGTKHAIISDPFLGTPTYRLYQESLDRTNSKRKKK